MLKAELELMKGANEASSLDLEQVRNLLDLCTGKDVIRDILIFPLKGPPRITKTRPVESSRSIICDFYM